MAPLTLVRPACVRLGEVEVHVGGPRPAWASVLVREEDRQRVLSADPDFRAATGHPIRVMTDVLAFEPDALGTARWDGEAVLCVVVDLDAEPLVDGASVESALRAALDLLASRRVASAGFEAVGAVHGGWPLADALACLGRVLAGASGGLTRAWVDAPSTLVERLTSGLPH